MRAETITIGSRTYRKFIPYPKPIRDGTVRCMACGQIDEPEYHEDALCPFFDLFSDGSEATRGGQESSSRDEKNQGEGA